MRFYIPERRIFLDLVNKWLKIDACCVLCGACGGFDRDLCKACESLLIGTLHVERSGVINCLCIGCGKPHSVQRQFVSNASIENRKIAFLYNFESVINCCSVSQSPFVRVIAPYRFDFPLNKMIRRLKYGHQRSLARVMGSLLAAGVESDGMTKLPDCLIPMPLHPVRMKSRGFNQAADIARWCGAELDVPIKSRVVRRVVDTGSMAGLSRLQRQLQILGAFRASEEVEGMHIAIVDDVLTTGATSREIARELYDRGAASVELWVLARTSSDRLSG